MGLNSFKIDHARYEQHTYKMVNYYFDKVRACETVYIHLKGNETDAELLDDALYALKYNAKALFDEEIRLHTYKSDNSFIPIHPALLGMWDSTDSAEWYESKRNTD